MATKSNTKTKATKKSTPKSPAKKAAVKAPKRAAFFHSGKRQSIEGETKQVHLNLELKDHSKLAALSRKMELSGSDVIRTLIRKASGK